jgi:hypothetical protein
VLDDLEAHATPLEDVGHGLDPVGFSVAPASHVRPPRSLSAMLRPARGRGATFNVLGGTRRRSRADLASDRAAADRVAPARYPAGCKDPAAGV